MTEFRDILKLNRTEFNNLVGSLDTVDPSLPGEISNTTEKQAQLDPPPNFPKVETELIEIFYGFWENEKSKGDFGWYIVPKHPKYNYGSLIREAMLTAGNALSKYIPDNIKVDAYAPDPAWEIKQISIIAREARQAWNIQDGVLEGVATTDLLKAMHDFCMKVRKAIR